MKQLQVTHLLKLNKNSFYCDQANILSKSLCSCFSALLSLKFRLASNNFVCFENSLQMWFADALHLSEIAFVLTSSKQLPHCLRRPNLFDLRFLTLPVSENLVTTFYCIFTYWNPWKLLYNWIEKLNIYPLSTNIALNVILYRKYTLFDSFYEINFVKLLNGIGF